MGLCIHPDCRENVPASRVACRPHWFQIPKPLRDAIWDAYRRKDRAASLRHIREAIRYFRQADDDGFNPLGTGPDPEITPRAAPEPNPKETSHE